MIVRIVYKLHIIEASINVLGVSLRNFPKETPTS